MLWALAASCELVYNYCVINTECKEYYAAQVELLAFVVAEVVT